MLQSTAREVDHASLAVSFNQVAILVIIIFYASNSSVIV